MDTKIRVKGHKIAYHKRGPNDAFWIGICECGWHYPGQFAIRRSTVTAAHRGHLHTVVGIEPEWVKKAKARAAGNI